MHDKDVAAYIRELLVQHSALVICDSLLRGVEDELFEADVLSVLFTCSKSVSATISCLRSKVSTAVRHAALVYFAKLWRGRETWQKAWDEMDGTKGLVEWLAQASVNEVRDIISIMARASIGKERLSAKEASIDQLFLTLCPAGNIDIKPIRQISNSDQRPLQRIYHKLITACSPRLVDEWIKRSDDQIKKDVPFKRLIEAQGDVLLRHIEEAMRTNTPLPHWWYRETLEQYSLRRPDLPGEEHYFSASMEYSERILQWRLKNLDSRAWPVGVSETSIYEALLRRCLKRTNLPKKRLRDIVVLGLDFIQARQNNAGSDFQKVKLWTLLSKRWVHSVDRWDDLFIQSLDLNLVGNTDPNHTLMRFSDLSRLDKERRWDLFRLCNIHIPEHGVDLDTSSDLSKLARKSWQRELFDQFEVKKSFMLLRRLLDVYKDYNFLTASNGTTILGMYTVGRRRNFNAMLFIALLSQGSSDDPEMSSALREVEVMSATFRQQSAASRDQVERAQYAKAACFAAIASGSLDLYAGTIEWTQRFVRDPLTVKTLFDRHSMLTEEGIELLSGIPSRLAETMTLAEASKRVSKANSILQALQEHMRLAKREPSYRKQDWDAVVALFDRATSRRIDNVRKMRRHLSASDGELFSALWSQTFAMLSDISVESLDRVRGSLHTLIGSLPPSVLATTTKALMEQDDVYRADKAKDKEIADKSRTMELLAYNGVRSLAASSRPDLASDLIIRTIITRPDASSWHRILLTLGYLKRLGAHDSEQMLLKFATAIGEKLQEQSYVRIGEKPGTLSIVKVTTVKYLAQLLQEAEFISASAAVDVLVELFGSATHIDIRIATFESLMSSLRDAARTSTDAPAQPQHGGSLTEKILTALQTIVPVAGSINERRPPSEQTWAEAEETPEKLPEPSACSDQTMPPLLASLLDTALQSSMKYQPLLQQELMRRVVLPILQYSANEQRRWISIFLRKHKAQESGLGARDIPDLPHAPVMTIKLLTAVPDYLSMASLTQLDTYAKVLLDPPESLKRFSTKLKGGEHKSSPDVEHWLAVYDRSPNDAVSIITLPLINLLLDASKLATSKQAGTSAITTERCQTIVLSHLKVLLKSYDKRIVVWNRAIDHLQLSTSASKELNASWTKYIVPLLESIIEAIDTKRSDPAWAQNRNRQPAILPHTSRIKLWLLTLAQKNFNQVDTGEAGQDIGGSEPYCKALASRLIGFISQQVGSSRSTGRTARLIEDILSLCPYLRDTVQISVGYWIGRDVYDTLAEESALRAEDLEDARIIQVKVARSMIEEGRRRIKIKKDDEELKSLLRRVQDLPQLWSLLESEEVREVAIQCRNSTESAWRAAVS